ncbi:STAS/SEC14 domain-containing protein [Desulfobacterales bacterium HSG17]|nr:STAS/SEC14 domain-containing protein [Desulfobacterales bacterium HSG17]
MKFVEINFSGTVTGDEIYQSREEALQVLLEYSFSHLLIDYQNAAFPEDCEQIIKFVSSHKIFFPEGTQMAVLISSHSTSFETINMGRFIARETQFNMEIFRSRGTAIQWLGQESGPLIY